MIYEEEGDAASQSSLRGHFLSAHSPSHHRELTITAHPHHPCWHETVLESSPTAHSETSADIHSILSLGSHTIS